MTTRLHRSSRPVGSAFLKAVACGAVCVAPSGAFAADTILEIYGPSLTIYKAGVSLGQDVHPRFDQRGVGIDGTLRAAPTFGWAIAGNPFGDAPTPSNRIGDVRLDTGAYAPTEVDMALPAAGPRWVVGRTYNPVQTGGASNGYQGKNWFQTSQPELAFYDDPTSDANDILYLVYGADRYIEFQRTGAAAATFKAKNGAAGAIYFDSSTTPDTYVYHDQNGNRVYFFGDDTSGDRADWQLWKIVDPAGQTAYVGHETNPATAASSGYNADKSVAVAYDHSGDNDVSHRYTYTYTTIDSVSRLTEVEAETNWENPGSEVFAGRVEYEYYTGNHADGDNGNLRLVTITTPLTDATIELVRHTHYRYYAGTDLIKYVVEPEGARRYDWDEDADLDEGFLTASDIAINPYAAAKFDYASGRIDEAWFNGECGCGGGGNGVHTITYDDASGYSGNIADTTYQNAWGRRAVIGQPDGTYVTQYFDETGQALSRATTDVDPATGSFDFWATGVARDSSGRVETVHTPANHTGYTHDTMGSPTGSFARSASVGLVHEFQRVSSGDEQGLLEAVKHKEGTGGTAHYDAWMAYSTRVLDVGGQGVVRPVVIESRAYHTGGASHSTSANFDATTMSYAWHEPSTDTDVEFIAPLTITTNRPVVTTGKNGSNTAEVVKQHVRADGTPAFSEQADGRIDYTGYTRGLRTRSVTDPHDGTGSGSTGLLVVNEQSGFGITLDPDGWAVIHESAYDAQGRPSVMTAPDGRVSYTYYSRLDDGRMVTISVPRRTGSGPYTYYGPASYTVTNLKGHEEFTATLTTSSTGMSDDIEDWILEGQYDPLLGIDLWTVARMSTSVMSDTGCKVLESRAYFDIPGSGDGTEGTHYDATFYGYDSMGRQWRVKDPTGSISRTVFDELGRAKESWTGTNDYSFTGGEASGPDDMVKVSETEYDGGNDSANSLVTKTTAFIQDSATGRRDTTFLHDYRGRAVVTLSPMAPYTLVKHDNLGRAVAVARYSSSSGLDISDDPTSLATNRVGLSQTFYDERGRVWKTQRHKIDLADGSDDDNLETLTWYDDDGRVVKVDGQQLTKAAFDRIGRPTRSYVLAKDNDSGYSDALTVSGDHVMEETVTVYESEDSSNVIARAVIARHHDDVTAGTTGGLDTNADNDDASFTAANIKGRVQITAMWHDAWDRVTDTVHYGTNGIVGDGTTSTGTFTRPGSPPSSAVATPRTTTVYNYDGTVLEVSDPRSKESRFVYDDAGRKITAITNYVNGTPSGVTGDDDLHTRWTYTDGLQTKMWVDLDGDNVEDVDDQVTTYTYGVAKGSNPDSRIASGRLLQKVTYPDSASGTDVVTFAYNAQGQQVYTKDQSGNVIETDYDDAGRQIHRRVSTLISGFDGAVRRITNSYAAHGALELVTQWNNAVAGSGAVVNEVKYTYSNWPGMLKNFEQDRDSAVGASSPNDYEVEYTFTKSTTGRNAVQRTLEQIYHASTLKHTTTYDYAGGGSDLDDELSRVTRVKIGATVVAHYDYTGVGQLVGVDYPEPDVFWAAFGSTTGSYPDLDALNRGTSATWTKDLATDRDFYDVDYTFDESSNIVRQVDNIHLNSTNRVFDAAYGVDGINRLASAVEGNWDAMSSTINVKSRQQLWTLTQTGNWDLNRWDHNGDGFFTGTDELDDRGTFNTANEWTARDIDDDSTDDIFLTYDAVGNLIDDGDDYEYEYDAFGRLRTLRKTSNQALVAEYTYNGLGHRIGWHYDVDGDGTVENTADDPWFYFAYDESWRLVATFRDTDADPKEVFVHHKAGLDGFGRGNGLDAVILRDKDANNSGGWASASDGVREERVYYVQTPGTRGDVVAIITSTGAQAGQTRYSAYGVPFGLPQGDLNADGAVNGSDSTIITGILGIGGYRVLADLDLDGDVDSGDASAVSGLSGLTLGRGKLGRDPAVSASAGAGNRRGYAGYEHDGAVHAVAHVRNRAILNELGRWTRRDSLGYIDGPSLYEYVRTMPIGKVDPLGLWCGPSDPRPPIQPRPTPGPGTAECSSFGDFTLPPQGGSHCNTCEYLSTQAGGCRDQVTTQARGKCADVELSAPGGGMQFGVPILTRCNPAGCSPGTRAVTTPRHIFGFSYIDIQICSNPTSIINPGTFDTIWRHEHIHAWQLCDRASNPSSPFSEYEAIFGPHTPLNETPDTLFRVCAELGAYMNDGDSDYSGEVNACQQICDGYSAGHSLGEHCISTCIGLAYGQLIFPGAPLGGIQVTPCNTYAPSAAIGFE